jgi:hypothetical protein
VTTDVAITPTGTEKITDFVGTGAYAGVVQLRVYTTRTAGAFFSSGNFMKLVYDAP